METAPKRILLSEGSSLSARQAVTVLGLAGHHIELVSNDRLCLAAWSRFVRKVHIVPRPGFDPEGYLAAVLEIASRRKMDLVLPVNEQAYLFAAARKRRALAPAMAVAGFEAFERVQSKAAFSALLAELDVPQPPTRVIHAPDQLPASQAFPFFAKAAYGTASGGVWKVADRAAWNALQSDFQTRGLYADGLVVQQPAEGGALHRTQSVFDHGRLVAIHAYRQLLEGTGGGDVLKLSVPPPTAHVERIGAALQWHGALSFDYFVEAGTGRSLFIDCNPRLVEPVNALFCGVDLAGAMVAISLGQSPPCQQEGRIGVTTRLGMMGILNAAYRHGTRRAVLAELAQMVGRTGRYRGTTEELTPMWRDPLSAIPFLFVLVNLLFSPARVARFHGQTVSSYSLSPQAYALLKGWASD